MRRPFQLVLALSACLCVSAAAASSQATTRTAPPARSLADLVVRFREARRPEAKALLGRWTQRQAIMLDRSPEGKPWERIFGARRSDIPGNPLAWVLEFRRVPGAGYEVTSHNPWEPTNDRSVIRFRATDITFEKETGSDLLSKYRCRALTRSRLVCLNAEGPVWQAVEFTKDQVRTGSAKP
jgi:hypothetical protein